MIHDALRNEVLSARALDYRRNTIGVGALIIILFSFPQADWSNLNFLGIKLGSNSTNTRSSVLLFVAAVYLYHAAFFAYYAWRDFRAWWTVAAEPTPAPTRSYFPEVGMYFGLPPKSKRSRRQTSSGWDEANWNFTRGKSTCTWQPTPIGEQTRKPDRYNIALQDFRRVREKIIWFAAIDVGVPFLIFTTALISYLLYPTA